MNIKDYCEVYCSNRNNFDCDAPSDTKCERKDAAMEAISANNAAWVEWAQSKCPHDILETGEILKLECYQCWQERKKSLSL